MTADDTLDWLEQADSHDDTVLSGFLDTVARENLMQEQGPELSREALADSDAVLRLIEEVIPGWSVHASGRALASNGRWKCTLRQSDSRDNDEFVGSGGGKVLRNAMLAALLRTARYLAAR